MEKEGKAILKVMVVDDNEVNTMILAKMLELFEISVDQANHGGKAIIMSQNTAYDIIFIDHIMPEMDGVQATAAIRNIAINRHKTIIIALTSDITENMISIFKDAGANDIYAKPLGLMELFLLIKKWCPEASISMVTAIDDTITSNKEEDYIQKIIREIDDIDYFIGLKYAIGKPIYYFNILKVSLKDIQLCINRINKSLCDYSIKELRIGVHDLISILSDIGAMELSEEARFIKTIALKYDIHNLEHQCIYFLNHLERFKIKLQKAIEKYNSSLQLDINEQEMVYIPMSKEEYEQSLLNTIYYIKRFEYDFIIKEMEDLIHRGQSTLKQEFEQAFLEIKDFNYDDALIRMIKIQKLEAI
ncbi:MAG: response regulator [Mobilitalea sp.]